jgi:SAM-dependent methyltransferase
MNKALLNDIRQLAPWHFDIPLDKDLSTIDGNIGTNNGRDYGMPVVQPTELRPLLEALYSNGLEGKRFLDCACNGGGYSILSHKLGADFALGFDVREHWINQARFLSSYFKIPDDRVSFDVCDLLDFRHKHPDSDFDICLFKGLFYHLPDPIAGLKLAADRTSEILILDTASVEGHEDGFLKLQMEGVVNPMSGVHELAWRPTGPNVLKAILGWVGFPATRLIFSRKRTHFPGRGRIRMVAARDEALLDGFDERFKQGMHKATLS